MEKVSLIVLNYNGLEVIKKTFSSYLKLDYPNYEIIFVDNASTDGSIDFINGLTKKTPIRIKIVRSEKNLGYAAGNNLGVKYASGKFLWILNNDVVVTKNSLKELVNFIGKDVKVGIVQPKVLQYDKPNLIDNCGLKFNFLNLSKSIGHGLVANTFNMPFEIGYASGSAMLIRKEVWDLLNGFDEKMFIYGEDIDFSLRTKILGYKVYCYPKAIVYHMGSATAKKVEYTKLVYYDTRNRLRVVIKDYKGVPLVLRLCSFLFLTFLGIVKDIFLRYNLKLVKVRILAIIWNVRMLSNIIKERKIIFS